MPDALPITTPREFFDSLRRGPYTSVGCYPVYWIAADGGDLSYEACRENAKRIGRAILEAGRGDRWPDKQWQVTHVTVNWEDPDLYCSHTGKRIESAYAEDEATEPCTITHSGLCLPGLEPCEVSTCT